MEYSLEIYSDIHSFLPSFHHFNVYLFFSCIYSMVHSLIYMCIFVFLYVFKYLSVHSFVCFVLDTLSISGNTNRYRIYSILHFHSFIKISINLSFIHLFLYIFMWSWMYFSIRILLHPLCIYVFMYASLCWLLCSCVSLFLFIPLFT
jgi:hypothetical protein